MKREKEFLMKVKVVGSLVLAAHVVVLAGLSMVQGCAMFHRTPKDEPVVLPAVEPLPVAPPATFDVPAPVPAPVAKTYRVQKGDTLSSIASQYGTSWKALADHNGLTNPNQLRVGQELRIPDSTVKSLTKGSSGSLPAYKKPVKPVSSRPIPGAIKQGSSYVVKRGDSLSSIAKRCGLTVSEIKLSNGLNSDSLAAGKTLTIPKKGEAKAPAPKASPAPAKVVTPEPALPAPAPMAVAAPVPALPAPAPVYDGAVAPAPVTPAPAAPAVAPAVPSAAPVASASAPVYEHVLYPGETLDDVARQYGSSQQEIMTLNNITDPTAVKPGTKLMVPIPE
jgi:LysM repeat protein